MEINNSRYFRCFNEDYQKGGIYSSLGNAELILLVKLLAYSSPSGYVVDKTCKGFSERDLSDITGLARKSVHNALCGLEDRGIIKTNTEDQSIYLCNFVNDMGPRISKNTYSHSQLRKDLKAVEAAADATLRSANMVHAAISSKKMGDKNGEQ